MKSTLFTGGITIATCVTCIRIFMIPFIVHYMIQQQWGIALVLFTIAAISDVIDGSLARFLHQESLMGAYLDPLADKLLMVSCYATLAFVDTPFFKIPLWFFIFLFIKELFLVIGAVYLGLFKQSISIKPALIGKCATLAQISFIWWLFISAFSGYVSQSTIYLFLIVMTLLTVLAFFHYLIIGYRGFKL
jgi:cardiolipin synthase (CMP-forming)